MDEAPRQDSRRFLADYGTNLVITEAVVNNDHLCFTWTALRGVHYFVQGTLSLSEPEWTTLSPTLTATAALSSYCVPFTPQFFHFRVCEGIVLSARPLLIDSVSAQPSGVLLQWWAEPGDQFRVEWRPTLISPGWPAFTNVVDSSDGRFQFLDDGSQSGGLGQDRFYRLQKLP